MKKQTMVMGALGALGMAATLAPTNAGANITIDDVHTPWASSGGRPVFEAKATGTNAGFLTLQMSVRGIRSSWSGMREEVSASYQTSDIGKYRKVEKCGVSGSYTRASQFHISANVIGVASLDANGYGASVTGPRRFDTSFNSGGQVISCSTDGYNHSWIV